MYAHLTMHTYVQSWRTPVFSVDEGFGDGTVEGSSAIAAFQSPLLHLSHDRTVCAW